MIFRTDGLQEVLLEHRWRYVVLAVNMKRCIDRRSLETPWRIVFLERSKITVIEMSHKVIQFPYSNYGRFRPINRIVCDVDTRVKDFFMNGIRGTATDFGNIVEHHFSTSK
jgi:hypothetical protein